MAASDHPDIPEETNARIEECRKAFDGLKTGYEERQKVVAALREALATFGAPVEDIDSCREFTSLKSVGDVMGIGRVAQINNE
jgi:hypothetical protein